MAMAMITPPRDETSHDHQGIGLWHTGNGNKLQGSLGLRMDRCAAMLITTVPFPRNCVWRVTTEFENTEQRCVTSAGHRREELIMARSVDLAVC